MIPPIDAHAMGVRIRAARLSRRWKLIDLAKATGFGLSTLSAFECGSRVPRLGTLSAIAFALRKKLDWLVRGRKNGGQNAPDGIAESGNDGGQAFPRLVVDESP